MLGFRLHQFSSCSAASNLRGSNLIRSGSFVMHLVRPEPDLELGVDMRLAVLVSQITVDKAFHCSGTTTVANYTRKSTKYVDGLGSSSDSLGLKTTAVRTEPRHPRSPVEFQDALHMRPCLIQNRRIYLHDEVVKQFGKQLEKVVEPPSTPSQAFKANLSTSKVPITIA